jgi:hypothetical protein
MSEAIPPLPNTPLWRSAQFKKSTGTTLPLPCTSNEFNEGHEECINRLVKLFPVPETGLKFVNRAL